MLSKNPVAFSASRMGRFRVSVFRVRSRYLSMDRSRAPLRSSRVRTRSRMAWVLISWGEGRMPMTSAAISCCSSRKSSCCSPPMMFLKPRMKRVISPAGRRRMLTKTLFFRSSFSFSVRHFLRSFWSSSRG